MPLDFNMPVLVVDDYGHHPVEIEATLEAADDGYPERRVVAVFQPHRYSRVRDLWDAFCAAFNRASEVVVLPIANTSSELFAAWIARELDARLAPELGAERADVRTTLIELSPGALEHG
mgnify:CR=1 FL=1